MAVQRSPAMVQRCHKLCNAAQRCATWSSDGIPSRTLHNVVQTLPNASQRCQTAVQRFSTMSEHMAVGSLKMTSSSLLTTLQQRCTTGARRCPAKVQCCYKLANAAQRCATLPNQTHNFPNVATRCPNVTRRCPTLPKRLPTLFNVVRTRASSLNLRTFRTLRRRQAAGLQRCNNVAQKLPDVVQRWHNLVVSWATQHNVAQHYLLAARLPQRCHTLPKRLPTLPNCSPTFFNVVRTRVRWQPPSEPAYIWNVSPNATMQSGQLNFAQYTHEATFKQLPVVEYVTWICQQS